MDLLFTPIRGVYDGTQYHIKDIIGLFLLGNTDAGREFHSNTNIVSN